MAALLFTAVLPSQARPDLSPSSVGPNSRREPSILWSDAHDDLKHHLWDRAIVRLQRLVDRYPADPHAIDAQRLIGEAQLQANRPEAAITPFKNFILARGTSLNSLDARLELGDAYLRAQKFDEADQVAREIRRANEKHPVPRTIEIGALLLEARALLERGETQSAQESLDQVKLKILGDELTLLAQSSWLDIRLQTLACSKIPGDAAPEIDEGQVREAVVRRGDCLSAALLTFRSLLRTQNEKLSAEASKFLEQGFQNYQAFCANPPDPKGKRSESEKKQYHRELIDILAPIVHDRLDRAIALLESWKNDIPSPTRSQLQGSLKKIRDDHR